ncbi:MAG: LVIVD repeat-containing protein [Bacteroidia bacterium]
MKNIKILIIGLFFLIALGNCSKDAGESSFIPGSDAQGGSLARFCIANSHLYVVDNSTLHVYSISDPANPKNIGSVNLGFGIETIFYHDNFLYIGSNNGMVICSLSNPAQPVVTGNYRHVTSCDPVVVQGDIAYVTLRTGTRCSQGINVLDVVDISNKSNPVSLKSIALVNPWGLGVDGKHLFVCDEAKKIVYFDLTDPQKPVQIKTFAIKAFDLIPSNNVLLTTGDDGITQYDYSNAPTTLTLLSKIEIGK